MVNCNYGLPLHPELDRVPYFMAREVTKVQKGIQAYKLQAIVVDKLIVIANDL